MKIFRSYYHFPVKHKIIKHQKNTVEQIMIIEKMASHLD